MDTNVVTTDAEHLVGNALKILLKQLDPAIFVQFDRSVVVNLNAIRSLPRARGDRAAEARLAFLMEAFMAEPGSIAIEVGRSLGALTG